MITINIEREPVYYFEGKSKFLIKASELEKFVREYEDYNPEENEPIEFLQKRGTVKIVDFHNLEYEGFTEI